MAVYPLKDNKADYEKLFPLMRKIQHRINAIDNVAKTTLIGAHKPQFNVEVDLNQIGSLQSLTWSNNESNSINSCRCSSM